MTIPLNSYTFTKPYVARVYEGKTEFTSSLQVSFFISAFVTLELRFTSFRHRICL